ncbi:MAG: hypothetical protein KGQ41_03440 [Alphaproteobacteria bacterium]|nr:hypothetical protein [Alphaproteobacteria bacterium]
MSVVPFNRRAAAADKAAYGEISGSAKMAAVRAVSDLYFAMTQTRTQTPEALKAFDRLAQYMHVDDYGFHVTIARTPIGQYDEPIVRFSTSLQYGWVCSYKGKTHANRQIGKLVEWAHTQISAQKGLALPPFKKTNNVLAIG